MKTPKIFAAAALGLASLAMTSCEDWLTIYPQNKLTDEQFWEDMNDLNGVRYAAYRNFASGDVVNKILAWGEFRSDNVNFSGYSNANSYNALLRITDGRLDTASNFNDWGTFYTTINYCNQVLYNGQIMQDEKRDPQFSATQWTSIKAEMIALRSLNYFYLVRAFGNVPYVNKVIKTDAEVSVHKQALQSNILDSLINDVDKIKDDVTLSYTGSNGFSSSVMTRSQITRPFAYTLLADMCMWRAAKYEGAARRGTGDMADAIAMYQRAYDYAVQARLIMDGEPGNSTLKSQYSALYVRDNRDLSHMGPYYLEQNFYQGMVDQPSMNAFSELFEEGGCDEVIFEMPFNTKDNQTNTTVNSYFGEVTANNGIAFYSNFPGLLICSPLSFDKNNDRDVRLMYSAAYHNEDLIVSGIDTKDLNFNGKGYIMKYHEIEKLSFDKAPRNNDLLHYMTFKQKDYNNFIIYRKSDALLIEAEALAILAKLGADNGKLADAQKIVAEHRRRSYGVLYEKYENGKKPGTYPFMVADSATWKTPDDILGHVLDEKQLEFVGEGKRWFDIVRYMERMGANREAITAMFEGGMNTGSMFKEQDHAQRYRSNLHARWAFYNPVYYPEREASGWVLTQNPYWDEDPTNNDPESDEPVKGEEPTVDDEPSTDNPTPDEPQGDEQGGEEQDEEPSEPTEE